MDARTEIKAEMADDRAKLAELQYPERLAMALCMTWYDNPDNREVEVGNGEVIVKPRSDFDWERNLTYRDRNNWRRVADTAISMRCI